MTYLCKGHSFGGRGSRIGGTLEGLHLQTSQALHFLSEKTTTRNTEQAV